MTIRDKVQKRFDNLNGYDKILANHYALEQFKKPIKERVKPNQILDFIEFEL